MVISLLALALVWFEGEIDQSTPATAPVQMIAEGTPSADPGATRLFFGPTGRSLKAGEVYASVYEIVLPFVQVGITDRFSIGAGTPLLFAVGAASPVWVTPKFQVINGKSVHASVGVLQFVNAGSGGVGVAYGVMTKGTADAAVSVGVGYGYRSLGPRGGSPAVMLGGERRVRRGLKVLSENYLFRDAGLVTGGVRFFGKHLAADLAWAAALADGDVVTFPVMNFAWKF